jgi:DNA-binding NtrC family response regulator
LLIQQADAIGISRVYITVRKPMSVRASSQPHTESCGRSNPLLSAAIASTRGNQIRAADLLGVNRNTPRKKIRDLEIQVIHTNG